MRLVLPREELLNSKLRQLWRGEKIQLKGKRLPETYQKTRMHAFQVVLIVYMIVGEKVMIPNVIRDHLGTTRRE